ncbi:MAG: class I SAM-dependent methyltransferase [Sphingobacteriia bacterium]
MDLKELRLTAGTVAARHPWELARLIVVKDLLRKVNFRPGEKLRVVDMGSGDTFVIEQLLNAHPHWEAAAAVDIAFSDDDLQQLRTRFANEGKAIAVFRDMSHIPDGFQADCILLLDVLEHIEDHEGFLQLLHTQPFIGAHTQLLVTVPAFQSLFSAHDVFIHHYRRYTRQQLCRTLATNGWMPYRSGYFFFSLLGPRLIQKWLGSRAGSTQGIGAYKRGPLDELIAGVLKLDYRLGQALRTIGLRLPGLSTYAICRVQHPQGQ